LDTDKRTVAAGNRPLESSAKHYYLFLIISSGTFAAFPILERI
jgi:hypothetical protein